MIERRKLRLAGTGALLALLFGCGDESTPPGGGPVFMPWPSTGVDAGAPGADGESDGVDPADGTSGNGVPGNGSGGDGSGGDGSSGDGSGDGAADGNGDGAGDGNDEDGSTGEPVDPLPGEGSSGCGNTDYPASGNYDIDVSGASRSYIVKLPDGYDANQPYKLIFTWHYLGGSAEGIARSYYGLEALAQDSAIFVSPQGIDAGWANTGGRDVAFARAMVDRFKADYCIDEARIFSAGFSYGAIMSNTVGCAMGDVFRAIAPMSGSGPFRFGAGSCTGQVAAWLYHGTADTVVSYSSGVGSRDHWLMSNNCSTQHGPADENGCVEYEGCDDGHPVIWCENGAGHTQPRFGSQAIWEFFSRF